MDSQGDVKSRYEAYRTAINSGLKSINEVSLENLPPIETATITCAGAMITLDNAVKGINQTGGGETRMIKKRCALYHEMRVKAEGEEKR